MPRNRQSEAVTCMRELLNQRSLFVLSRNMSLPDNQKWIVFTRGGRQVGVDMASGVWVREDVRADWRCISMPCSTSGALQAVEFLCAATVEGQ